MDEMCCTHYKAGERAHLDIIHARGVASLHTYIIRKLRVVENTLRAHAQDLSLRRLFWCWLHVTPLGNEKVRITSASRSENNRTCRQMLTHNSHH